MIIICVISLGSYKNLRITSATFIHKSYVTVDAVMYFTVNIIYDIDHASYTLGRITEVSSFVETK